MHYKELEYCQFVKCLHADYCPKFLTDFIKQKAAQTKTELKRFTEKPDCYKDLKI